MKIIVLLLYLFLTVTTGSSMMALPAGGSTNELTEINRLSRINAERQQYYRNGRIDRMEHEVNRLETGFVVLAVVIGSTFASLLALAIRDKIPKTFSASSPLTPTRAMRKNLV